MLRPVVLDPRIRWTLRYVDRPRRAALLGVVGLALAAALL